jgi:hypothetical protein
MLVICSTDGYVTFARFPDGCLGVPLEDNDVPLIVKQTYPSVYNYATPELIDEEAEQITASTDPNQESPIENLTEGGGSEKRTCSDSDSQVDQTLLRDVDKDKAGDLKLDGQKKRRIAPNVGFEVSGPENKHPQSDTYVPVQVSEKVVDSTTNPEFQKKEKKRITPMHLEA